MTGPGAGSRDTATEAVSQCRAVLLDFLAAIDHGHATRALGLFTADATLDVHGKPLRGRKQIASFLTRREAEDRSTVHQITNEVVRSCTGDAVTITALLFLFQRDNLGAYVLHGVLDTVQTFRHTDQGWRITTRHTAPVHP